MSRLVDELLAKSPRLAGGGYNPPTNLRDQVLATLQDQLSNCEVFLIDNVADYWNANGGWIRPLHKEDFPNTAPPFDQFFVEHRLHDENRQTPDPNARIGVLFTVVDEDVDGWKIEICPYLGSAKGPIGPIDIMFLIVDPSGRILDFRSPKGAGLERSDDLVIAHWHMIAPALLSISFLHCRNVTTEVVAPDQKLNRARARRGKRPLRRYKVLRIEPMTKTLSSEGNIEGQGLAKALHICRGHFKTYEERPLFGRLRGTWFWQDHVRGSLEAGVVEKDYRVDAPAADLTEAVASARRQAGTHPT